MGAANMLSPGVATQEFDVDQIVASTSTWIGALSGIYEWGPVGFPMTINNPNTYSTTFGNPTSGNYETWFTGYSFLAYSDNLVVVRAANCTSNDATIAAYNAIGNTASANVLNCVIKNPTDFAAKETNGFDPNVLWIARYPGSKGNSIRVAQCDTANQFSSNLALNSSAANAQFVMNVGSNTATIIATPILSGTVTDANTLITNIIDSISIGDYLVVGNTTISTQYVQVSSVPQVPVVNSTAASVTLNFSGALKLKANAVQTGILQRFWEFYNAVGVAPGQSAYVATYGNTAAQDELHVVIVDDGGDFTGVPGTVLETYAAVSRATDAVYLNGEQQYVKEVINQGSQYIYYVNDRPGAASANANFVATSTALAPLDMTLGYGSFGASESNASLATIASGYDFFADKDAITVDLMMQGKPIGANYTQLGNYVMDNITSERLDHMFFYSPNLNTVLNNVGFEASSIVNFRQNARVSSYCAYDTGYKQMYDQYNNVYRWIPLNGDIAGLCAQTAYPWISPAGFNRGAIKNIVKLAYSPSKTDRDTLYTNQINPVVTFRNQGTVLYGDITGQSKASSFSHINVRRLFLYLERIISAAAQYSLFELNDTFTRAQFINLVTPTLRTVKGQRGVFDYQVVCDTTNNPGSVVDANQFVGDILIKPEKSINFITLNFVAVGTDVAFSSVEGQFG